MAIVDTADLVVTYDANRLVVSTRILAPDAPEVREHAAQCLMVEIVRDILSTGITVAEWNAMGPEWDAWWAARQDAGRGRVVLNVAARAAPHLTQDERNQVAAVASTFFERGYVDAMAGISSENRVAFTRTDGL